MSNIIDFRPAERSDHNPEERAESASCEIILFPGVRYERWEDAPPPEAKADGTSGKSRARKKAGKAAK